MHMKTKTAIKLVFGVLVMLVLFLSIGLDKVASSIWSINIPLFLLAVLVIVPLAFTGSMKWWLILRSSGVPASIGFACRTFLIGGFFSFITPSKVGSLSKFYYVKKHYGTPSSTSFSLAFMDKVFDMFVVLAIASSGAYALSILSSIWLQAALVIVLFMLIFLVLAFSSRRFFVAIATPVLSKLRFLGRALKIGDPNPAKIANQLYDPFSCLRNKPHYFIGIASASVLYWVIYGLQLTILVFALGASLGPMTGILMACIGTAVGLVPVTIDGIGTREATLVYLLSLSGISLEAGIAAAAVLFALTHVASLAGGVAYLADPKVKAS